VRDKSPAHMDRYKKRKQNAGWGKCWKLGVDSLVVPGKKRTLAHAQIHPRSQPAFRHTVSKHILLVLISYKRVCQIHRIRYACGTTFPVPQPSDGEDRQKRGRQRAGRRAKITILLQNSLGQTRALLRILASQLLKILPQADTSAVACEVDMSAT